MSHCLLIPEATLRYTWRLRELRILFVSFQSLRCSPEQFMELFPLTPVCCMSRKSHLWLTNAWRCFLGQLKVGLFWLWSAPVRISKIHWRRHACPLIEIVESEVRPHPCGSVFKAYHRERIHMWTHVNTCDNPYITKYDDAPPKSSHEPTKTKSKGKMRSVNM